MSRQFTPLSALVNDYMLLAKEEDRFDKHISETKCRSLALQGLREVTFDVGKSLNAIVLDVDPNTLSVPMPSDYLNYVRIGFIGQNGEFMPLGVNNNLGSLNEENLLDNTGAKLLDSDGIEITAYYQNQNPQQSGSVSSAFSQYLRIPYRVNKGGMYGVGGGENKNGSYRIDNKNSRIHFSSGTNEYNKIILEYIADEAMSSNPRVPSFCVETVKSYIYTRFIEAKVNVPANEKARAESKFYREKKKSRARMNSISKAEIMQQITRRFQLAGKLATRVYH